MNSRRLTGRPFKQRVLPYHAVGCIVITAILAADVRFGSKAEIARCQADVRFTPKSGHLEGDRHVR